MSTIAEVVAGAVQGITNSVTEGINKGNELYTSRVLGSAELRNKGSLNRSLPLFIIAGIVLIVIGVLVVKK